MDTGGYAFPCEAMEPVMPNQALSNTPMILNVSHPGMTTLDYFAAKCFVAFLLSDSIGGRIPMSNEAAREIGMDSPGYYAKIAYQQAEALIAERQRLAEGKP